MEHNIADKGHGCHPVKKVSTLKEVERDIKEAILHFGTIVHPVLKRQDDGKYTLTVGCYNLTSDLIVIREYLHGLWTGLCLGSEITNEAKPAEVIATLCEFVKSKRSAPMEDNDPIAGLENRAEELARDYGRKIVAAAGVEECLDCYLV